MTSHFEELVEQILTEWIDAGRLFTALDVSNEVKKTLPQKKHREVRDEVRLRYVDLMETQGYTRTPIPVSLSDSSTTTAMLYHPLSDTWDLDTKYDQQKRSQTSSRPVAVAQAAVKAAQPSAPLTQPAAPSTAAPFPGATTMVITPMPTARQQWDQLFATQPSLFPKR